MTRKEAQNILLNSLNNDGKKWDDVVYFIAKSSGKYSWTKKEVYDAVLEDRCVEGGTFNPIDSLLRFEEWKRTQKNNI